MGNNNVLPMCGGIEDLACGPGGPHSRNMDQCFQNIIRCPDCDSRLHWSGDINFCGNCGARLEKTRQKEAGITAGQLVILTPGYSSSPTPGGPDAETDQGNRIKLSIATNAGLSLSTKGNSNSFRKRSHSRSTAFSPGTPLELAAALNDLKRRMSSHDQRSLSITEDLTSPSTKGAAGAASPGMINPNKNWEAMVTAGGSTVHTERVDWKTRFARGTGDGVVQGKATTSLQLLFETSLTPGLAEDSLDEEDSTHGTPEPTAQQDTTRPSAGQTEKIKATGRADNTNAKSLRRDSVEVSPTESFGGVDSNYLRRSITVSASDIFLEPDVSAKDRCRLHSNQTSTCNTIGAASVTSGPGNSECQCNDS